MRYANRSPLLAHWNASQLREICFEENWARCKIEWGEFLSTRDAAFVRGSLLGAGVASHIRPDVGCDARSAFTELNHRVSEITRSQDRSVQTAQLKYCQSQTTHVVQELGQAHDVPDLHVVFTSG